MNALLMLAFKDPYNAINTQHYYGEITHTK
jgi:hypothetical protein